MDDFLLFLLVGFLAQIVDGALGMAFGVISSTVLLSFGVTPAMASATVHAAEVFTTAASAGSHAVNKNVKWKLFVPLAAGGCVGGAIGAFVLTGIDASTIKPWIVGYLGVMGSLIIYRAFRARTPKPFPVKYSGPLGFVGGFLDALGGGGWGPTVTSAMVGSGAEPRTSVGTTNTAEFFVTATISAAFLVALLSGHWQDAEGLGRHAQAVAGLVAGGLIAAPLAGFVVRIMPVKLLTFGVGGLVVGLALYQGVQLAGVF